MNVRAVVFDLGGVLVDWNPEYVYRNLIPDPQQRQWFLAHICSNEWNLQQDAGRSLADGTAELVRKHPQYATWICAFYARWTEMLGGPIPEMIRLLEELTQHGMPLYALTNWSAETFHHARNNFAFLDRFSDIIVSGEHGVIKPEPAIYQLMFDRMRQDLPDLQPRQIVFIDDNERNIHAACHLGWQGIHHKDARASRASFRQLGLPV